MLIDLDFETYSDIDLPKHGLDRYLASPNFTPIIASAQREDGQLDRFQFVGDVDRDSEVQALAALLEGNTLGAHNVGFELGVLRAIGIDHPLRNTIDSAVVARSMGAGSKLEAAAPQLLGVDKMPDGGRLIRLFSIPGKYQEENGDGAFDARIIETNLADFELFKKYCDLDTILSMRIIKDYQYRADTGSEGKYHSATLQMNSLGWPVDLKAVAEMQRRYLENIEVETQRFRQDCDADELNLSSGTQLVKWCAERGIKSRSFDVANVARLLKAITKKVDGMQVDDPKRDGYVEVIRMLHTKQLLGGSSLKKLAVILNTTGEDARLRDQYMHIGAGQTWRTTGRGVQMQNLPRFDGEPANMEALHDDEVEWSNDELASNIRQVFTASQSDGFLIVGDLASIESRGLAWQANEFWKLQAYRKGKDVYKELAAKSYSISYDAVTKPQRTFGKVGELSCGYGAAGPAVQSFAAGMGVELTEGEAAKLVSDWRHSNEQTVQYWWALDEMLHRAVELGTTERRALNDGYVLYVERTETPQSLLEQVHPSKVNSVQVSVLNPNGKLFMRRFFHGCHMRGRNVGYFKPKETKHGDLWDNMYTNPKTQKREFHNLYGGKLAGIITQSFCREIFFGIVWQVKVWADRIDNVEMIGQFHDEIVLDWRPRRDDDGQTASLEEAKFQLETFMTYPGDLHSFPMGAEVKHDYRYTK